LIRLFNWRSGKYIAAASIKDQCQRHKFYEFDELEDLLGEVEGTCATALSALIKRSQFPISLEDYDSVLYFVSLQLARTERAANEFLELNKETIKMAQSAERIAMKLDDSWQSKDQETPTKMALLRQVGKNLNFLYELEPVICYANEKQNQTFYTSDSPVILYNQYFEGIETGVGLGSFGVQVFLPLNPTRLLFLYDPTVYRVNSDKHRRIRDLPEEVVFHLNTLQFLASQNNVYFGNQAQISRVIETSSAAARIRPNKRTIVEKYEGTQNQGTIIRARPWRPNLKLNLRFCQIDKTKRKLSINERLKNKTRMANISDSSDNAPAGEYKRVL